MVGPVSPEFLTMLSMIVAPSASARFIAGPAAATQTMSRSGFRKFWNTTGTGLA